MKKIIFILLLLVVGMIAVYKLGKASLGDGWSKINDAIGGNAPITSTQTNKK